MLTAILVFQVALVLLGALLLARTRELVAEAKLLFSRLKKHVDWSEEHGRLNDQHKRVMQDAAKQLSKKVEEELPGKVKEAVAEGIAAATDPESGTGLPTGGAIPKPKVSP
jgi:hypothetical protein